VQPHDDRRACLDGGPRAHLQAGAGRTLGFDLKLGASFEFAQLAHVFLALIVRVGTASDQCGNDARARFECRTVRSEAGIVFSLLGFSSLALFFQTDRVALELHAQAILIFFVRDTSATFALSTFFAQSQLTALMLDCQPYHLLLAFPASDPLSFAGTAMRIPSAFREPGHNAPARTECDSGPLVLLGSELAPFGLLAISFCSLAGALSISLNAGFGVDGDAHLELLGLSGPALLESDGFSSLVYLESLGFLNFARLVALESRRKPNSHPLGLGGFAFAVALCRVGTARNQIRADSGSDIEGDGCCVLVLFTPLLAEIDDVVNCE